ncbi:hypothetical protein [Pseudodesulfovibrio sp.]|uniref:hypothetical protein n=1 Tax=Pseudodesulfovibrio sp. TaxID=2035812 RepID=UPI0026375F62|nr:hypothetical protein [Pseudodesulfovibrio sp.]MDD3311628.1 hypothetical protein [Pseudodesulfovibrio sp.]
MRTSSNQNTVAPPMPFDGLGLPMASVRAASREMRPVFHPQDETAGPASRQPFPDALRQIAGYQLLVALGREIRGR